MEQPVYNFIDKTGSGRGVVNKEKFYQYIDQYKDTDWYNQYVNAYNAYSGQVFRPNFWQKLGEDIFGDYQARENWDNAQYSTFLDAISRIQDAQHQESFNNPISQVQRDKSAGLNDDLNGGSSLNPGDPGNIDQAEMAQPAIADSYSAVNEIGNAFLSMIQTAFSLASSVQGLQSGSLNIANQQLSQRSGFIDLITSELARNFTPDDMKVLLSGDDGSDKYRDLRTGLFDVVSGMASDSTIPYSIRKKFSRIKYLDGVSLSNLSNQNELFKIMNDYANNRLGAVEGLGHPFNSKDFAECVKLFGEFYNQYELEYEKLIKNFDFEKYNVTDADGFTQGSLAGAANVAGLSFEAFQKQNDELVEKMWNNIYKKLESKHSDFADILIMLIPMFRSMMMSARIPSLNLGASWQGGSQTKTNIYRKE